jgi:RNA recognition motif-containing protein
VQVQIVSKSLQIPKKIVSPQKETITLYVGKLSEDFRDDLFEEIFKKCGQIVNWKRAKHSFGFVEFKEPEGALRCMSVINGLRIKDKKILVTADETMTKLLKNYKEGLKLGKFPLPRLPDIIEGKEDKGKTIEQRLTGRDNTALLEIQQLLREYKLTPIKFPSFNSENSYRKHKYENSKRDIFSNSIKHTCCGRRRTHEHFRKLKKTNKKKKQQQIILLYMCCMLVSRQSIYEMSAWHCMVPQSGLCQSAFFLICSLFGCFGGLI